MIASTSPFKQELSARYADWWPPLLVVALLVLFWVTMLNRAERDDALAIRDAMVNHDNVALAMSSHTDQLLDRLRFYGQILSGGAQSEPARTLISSAARLDRSFLRLMYFDDAGSLLFSTGRKPEPWLLALAGEFARRPVAGTAGEIAIGTVPPLEYAQAWNLPMLYRPSVAGAGSGGFLLALVDLGNFPRRFEDVVLGKSGEIVLLANDGRELLRMNGSRLDRVGSIVGTERFRLAFAGNGGQLSEQTDEARERLYSYRKIPSSPLAVLVSRSRYDVLQQNHDVQRGYFGAALLMTLLMLFLTGLWIIAAHRRHLLIGSLTLEQENNARLIAQIEKEKEAAYRLATYDKLTELPNRMLFADLASRYVGRAKRLRGRFAVMFIDLDRFKPINDTYGHKVGDLILIEVSKRLQQCMRQSDVVSRYGGDEFVALVADLRSSQDAAGIAGKIIESVSENYVDLVDAELRVTPSIGIAFYPDDADEIEVLVRRADAAMYQAKGKGRATFAFADPELNRRIEFGYQIEAALPAAFANREIEVHYQPKVSLADFSITGLEALARWNHPQFGPISPGDFIPVAEKCGAIVELGEYIIDAVCRQLAQWSQAGVPLVPVAVNISPLQLRSPQLYDVIVATLAQYGIAPRFFEIEITETGLVDTDDFIDTLRRLDDLGIHLAIDDFGTGYSGLSHLRDLPAKFLKIDRCFIEEIRNDSTDAAIVSNTISLSHNLRLLTIAEGVETREQVAHLRAARCDQAQGYYFSPPCAATAVEPLLVLGQLHGNTN